MGRGGWRLKAAPFLRLTGRPENRAGPDGPVLLPGACGARRLGRLADGVAGKRDVSGTGAATLPGQRAASTARAEGANRGASVIVRRALRAALIVKTDPETPRLFDGYS